MQHIEGPITRRKCIYTKTVLGNIPRGLPLWGIFSDVRPGVPAIVYNVRLFGAESVEVVKHEIDYRRNFE